MKNHTVEDVLFLASEPIAALADLFERWALVVANDKGAHIVSHGFGRRECALVAFEMVRQALETLPEGSRRSDEASALLVAYSALQTIVRDGYAAGGGRDRSGVNDA